MTFPKVDLPVYKINILSQKDPVAFLPFTVKEQKILMMAKESQDTKTIIDAVRQIINNCLLDKNIDVDKLPMVDLEWLMVNIQARSAGEKVPVYYKCNNIVEGNVCNMIMDLEVDLLKTEVVNKDVDLKIMITSNIGIVMKLPTFETTQKLVTANTEKLDIILSSLCIDYVFDEQSVMPAKDAKEEELIAFIEGLPSAKYEAIEQFFDNCPVIRLDLETDCPKCKFHHKITLEGLEDFFT